ncbi:hypothetical protein KGQ29_03920 [Patescibacteria group bacterium]|nr:hypothetical protein [Patescibacteria group bacterium]
MNGNVDQKKISVIEDALKLKDEGRRLSSIVEKFPDYESEIREVFGTAAFIMENEDRIFAPKNILKTILSKMADNMSHAKAIPRLNKEIAEESKNSFPIMEAFEEGDASLESENSLMFRKWKIIIPVIILAIITGIILLRSGSRVKSEIIDKNIETAQKQGGLNSVSNSSANHISSRAKEDNN